MKAMTSKTFVKSVPQHTWKTHIGKSRESCDSDSEDDERERRKYLSLQGEQSYFWSSNRLNKNFNKAECFEDVNPNYLLDRTSSVSKFKRNVHARHSLQHHRRRPLANIDNVELHKNFHNNCSPQHNDNYTLALDDIEMNNSLEYGFNTRRVSCNKDSIQLRLRPVSICTPSMDKCDSLLSIPYRVRNERSNEAHFTLAKLSPKVISYATNEQEEKLEQQLLNLQSQSCNLNFQGCEGNPNMREQKEDLAVARRQRQRFVSCDSSFKYNLKKRWKKTVSLDSGLATENTLLVPFKSKDLLTSKSEEILNDNIKDKCRKKHRKKTKSVEFLDVRKDSKDNAVLEENKHDILTEVECKFTINGVTTPGNNGVPTPGNDGVPTPGNDGVTTPGNDGVTTPGNDGVTTPGNDGVRTPANDGVTTPGNDGVSTPGNDRVTPDNNENQHASKKEHVFACTLTSEHNAVDKLNNSSTMESPVITASLETTPTGNTSPIEKAEKSSEKSRRLKTNIPNIFSSFRLPNKSTFRKLIRRKTTESPTPTSDEVNAQLFNIDVSNVKTELFKKCEFENINLNHASNINNITKATQKDRTLDKNIDLENFEGDKKRKAVEVSITQVIDDTEDKNLLQCTRDQHVSNDSFNSYEQPTGKTENHLIDKSISAHSLERVDEDEEFSSCLQRRSCSISVLTGKSQSSYNIGDGQRISDTDVAWDERLTRCSPGKRFMKRILSPVVCGFLPADKYGILNDSIHSLNSYDSGSITSESEQNSHLFDFPLQELVEEMTLIDKELLVHIPWEELAVLGWMSPDKFLLAPNIMKMVQFFNRTAMLVTTNVLLEESVYRRAKIIKKAIKLAYICRCVRNYNSLKAVLGGLQCTPVFRLKATWKEVPSKYRRIFRDLSELMNEENNFANYRTELSMALLEPPCIPFLGNFLTEVAHTHAVQAVHAKYRAATVLANIQHQQAWDDVTFQKHNVNHIPVVDVENTEDTDEQLFLKKNHLPDEHANLLPDAPVYIINGRDHSRTDSDDSGVVLSVKRYSNYSEDLESPRESCLSSPDEGVSSLGVPTSEHNYPIVDNGKDSLLVKKISMLRECECLFWKYQINCVAYNYIKRPCICRYLVNSPFNNEEDSYKLSLKREPPKM